MTSHSQSVWARLVASCAIVVFSAAGVSGKPLEPLFEIGTPDGSADEFGMAEEGWSGYLRKYPVAVEFMVGRSALAAWPYLHPSRNDRWAGGSNHTFTIQFQAETVPAADLFLIIGQMDTHTTERPLLKVSVNGVQAGNRQAAPGSGGATGFANTPGLPAANVFKLPPGLVRSGVNNIQITAADGSWILYDYVRLGTNAQPPVVRPSVDLLAKFRKDAMSEIEDVVFAVRKVVPEHWYANFSYVAAATDKSYFGTGATVYRDGGRLCRLNLSTGKTTVLLDDPKGGVRDPQVSYDGKRILFSYRKGGTPNYLLYEIGVDGTGLRQITTGGYDDIEPSYLPDGGIVFVSSRCQRWVNCWVTQVAVLHRCDADGGNLRAISSNNEHDNTPWPLPDGRILYTRWEYVDRSQVDYHHLWVVNPDGTGQMVYYGNLHPSEVMIDAKPVPGSSKIVACFSPGHGQTEHEGSVALVDSRLGPDARPATRTITRAQSFRDPWAFSETAFMAAHQQAIVLIDQRGRTQEIFRLAQQDAQAGLQVHEPRPVIAREREALVPARVKTDSPTGRLMLADIYEGRNMGGVKRGEIKKLLVLETLPKPINFTGGMDPLSYGGTFTLERVVGTVPVESDGSAYFEVPAMRSVFFVALDERDMAVKRMQSFVTVQPGEVTSCVGCHEQRSKAVPAMRPSMMASRRAPDRIQPIEGMPEVFDFPRDVQPVLDRLCGDCHGYEKTARGGPYAGRLLLSGDRGPMFSHSYFMLTVRRLFADGRNEPVSNYAPRRLGSSGSRLLQLLDGSHYGVKASAKEAATLRLWIETGSAYPGTYAALGTGMIGGYEQNNQVNTDESWPATRSAREAMARRCAACHKGQRALPQSMSDELEMSFWRFSLDDPRLQFSRHKLFNLTRPERSLLLLAPLDPAAGGFGICAGTNAAAHVLRDLQDPDYKALLAMAQGGKARLEEIKRFDMPGFQPRREWVREMVRYGVLAASAAQSTELNPYDIERDYWRSLWYRPVSQGTSP